MSQSPLYGSRGISLLSYDPKYDPPVTSEEEIPNPLFPKTCFSYWETPTLILPPEITTMIMEYRRYALAQSARQDVLACCCYCRAIQPRKHLVFIK